MIILYKRNFIIKILDNNFLKIIHKVFILFLIIFKLETIFELKIIFKLKIMLKLKIILRLKLIKKSLYIFLFFKYFL